MKHIERQTMESKQELDAWRKEAKKLEEMIKKPNHRTEMLSDIMSDVYSRKDWDDVRISIYNH